MFGVHAQVSFNEQGASWALTMPPRKPARASTWSKGPQADTGTCHPISSWVRRLWSRMSGGLGALGTT